MLSTSPAGHGQLVKILITLKPHGIKFCLVIYCLATGFAKRGFAEHLTAGQGLLVKMLTPLEPHGIC